MKAQAKAKTETKAAAPVVIKVPAALSASIATLVEANAGEAKARQKKDQCIVKIAETIADLFDSREEAKPVLAKAYEDAKLTSLVDGQQRSRILAQAFPKNVPLYNQAKTGTIKIENKAGKIVEKKADTNQLIAVANGGLKPDKKGVWRKVESVGNQGGKNKKAPLETMQTQMALNATAFLTVAKGDWEAFLNAAIEGCKTHKGFDAEEAKALLDE